MKTQFQLKPFSLDISSLSKLTGSHPDADFKKESNVAWEKFIRRTQSNEIGFFDWPVTCATGPLKEIKTLANTIRNQVNGAICIGIGGSYLGPAAIQEVYQPFFQESHFSVRWVSNVDSATIAKAEQLTSEKNCCAVIISKSGGTTETLAAWFHLSRLFSADKTVVITDPLQGELRRLSTLQNWQSLPVPPNIGGRFSVLTAVGLFPLALQGIPVEELIRGAQDMRETLLNSRPDENPAIALAFSKYLADLNGYSVQYLMPYDSRLKLLADWYVQLWGESLGKRQLGTGKSVGPNPVAALGTSDQHSLLQLFKEGPAQRVIGFLTAHDSKSPQVGEPTFSSPDFSFLEKHTFSELNIRASEATEESLNKSQVPTYRISLSDLSPYTLGAFILFQETACAIAGELYRVNAFDQPGVEESKRILKKKLIS